MSLWPELVEVLYKLSQIAVSPLSAASRFCLEVSLNHLYYPWLLKSFYSIFHKDLWALEGCDTHISFRVDHLRVLTATYYKKLLWRGLRKIPMSSFLKLCKLFFLSNEVLTPVTIHFLLHLIPNNKPRMLFERHTWPDTRDLIRTVWLRGQIRS